MLQFTDEKNRGSFVSGLEQPPKGSRILWWLFFPVELTFRAHNLFRISDLSGKSTGALHPHSPFAKCWQDRVLMLRIIFGLKSFPLVGFSTHVWLASTGKFLPPSLFLPRGLQFADPVPSFDSIHASDLSCPVNTMFPTAPVLASTKPRPKMKYYLCLSYLFAGVNECGLKSLDCSKAAARLTTPNYFCHALGYAFGEGGFGSCGGLSFDIFGCTTRSSFCQRKGPAVATKNHTRMDSCFIHGI
eukprot:284814577_4